MRLVLLGPPGIGKGTQARVLARRYSLVHLSTGDILRSEMTGETELGRLARRFIDRGKLVPDNIMLDMMTRRLKQDDVRRGYILDGFPRTVSQAEGLDSLLNDLHQALDAVIALEGSEELVVERLSNRRTCRGCGAITNLITRPPATEGRCHVCGGELYQRGDDEPAVVRKRLAVYRRQTEPLIGHYGRQSLLKRVDGSGSVEEVTEKIIHILF
ncbi:MAG: adenylate kinase [Fidelibacterota bacterium]